MKQILSLALALLPCLAWAQYPSNGNQKITLGEQTTADGLIWRGVAADTTLTAKSDTATYFVLDTANLNLYTYKASATGRKWRQLGADTAAIAYVNTYGNQTVAGAKTFSSTVTGARFDPTSSSASGTGMYLPATKTIGFSINGTERFRLDSLGNANLGAQLLALNPNIRAFQMLNSSFYGFSNRLYLTANSYPNVFGNDVYINNDYATLYLQINGEHRFYKAGSGTAGNAITFTQAMTLDADGDLGINTASPSEKLHVVGNGRFTAVGAGTFSNNLNITSDGTLTTATSDIKFKYNIRPLSYGLETLLQLKPVNFQWIEGEEEDLGFIAQDVAEIIPESVNTNWNSDLLFRYESLIPILTKAIQEQQALIKALEQRIINLENK